VPVEATGGEGTAGVHWREDVLGEELMTGWLSGPAQPLSLTTVRSLEDLGYEVDPAAAEPFAVRGALRALRSAEGVALGEDVLALPLTEID
jgi:hypothetical protein